MKRGRWIGLVGLAIALLVGLYVGSPYMAFNALREGVVEHDTARLEQLVDFADVREGLKADLNAILMAKFNADPEMKSNPFAALGAVMIPGIVNAGVDKAVTPEGLSKIIEEGRLGDKDGSAKPTGPEPYKAPTEFRLGYRKLDRFVAERETAKGSLKLVMARCGLFSWRVIRIELPKDLLAEDFDTARAKAAQP